jgi:phosphate acyltransferase
MNIAVDAMGGDYAPEEIIKGVIKACNDDKELSLTLVGKSDIIKHELSKYIYTENCINIVHASQQIEMNESPSFALRNKKDSSILVASNLLRENKVDAFVSAGSTGAVMAAGLLRVGMLKGIKRPSIAITFPSLHGNTLILDAGANTDCKEDNLLQFAIMGQIYARNVMKINNPRIGLLSIGEEKKKGNRLTTNTFELLDNDNRLDNFIGNVEGRDIFNGNCDVVICDGFVGNVVLKTTEGTASLIFKLLKETFTKNVITKIGALLVKPYLNNILSKVDYHQYGGAPLLGVKGVIIISHGSSNATAIMNAIKMAKETVKTGVVKMIEVEINKDGDTNES